jgi:uncharacterized protein (TIGR03905 family)
MYTYKTKGSCSSKIDIETRDGVIQSVRFTDGCSGNAQGMAMLLAGMPVDEAIEKLRGIQCRNGTSCPDQLSKALVKMKQEGL